MVPGLSPPPCHESNDSHCSSTTTATTSQLLLLCTSLGMIAVGGGGIRSSSLAFGIDQLFSLDKDENGKKNGGFLDKFYGWYYATFMLSILIGNTLIVYIQDKMGWQIGFGVSVVLMLLSAIFFFLGSPFYVKAKGKPNLITELIQVIVASFKKRNIHIGYVEANMINYHHTKGSSSTLYFPSRKFR